MELDRFEKAWLIVAVVALAVIVIGLILREVGLW